MSPTGEPDVRITLRAAAPLDGPLSRLVARLLKHLLRTWGLRCLKVEWLPPAKGEEACDRSAQ